MKLAVLGSGTSVPHAQRTSAAFWLETETGSVLLDCSAEAAHRMAQEKLDWPNLDAIWISHLHLDHCGGLASFLFGTKWAPQTQSRRKPLKIFACEGVRNLLTGIDESNNYRLFEQPFPIGLSEVVADANNQAVDFEILTGLRAQIFSTPHTRESCAIRLTDESGTSLVYTSDTGYSEDLARFAHGVDLLILECSFWRDKPIANHLELAEAMRLARLAEPRVVLLTHLYPEWDRIDIEHEAGEFWPGTTIAARDGLRLEVGQKPDRQGGRIQIARTKQMLRRLINFLIFFLIMSYSFTAIAQKSPADDQLLEIGHASKLVTPPGTPSEIKIVSYNIRWRTGMELEEIVRWLKGNKDIVPPVIIGLQEVDRAKQRTGKANNARTLADDLGLYYGWTAPPPAKSDKSPEEETGVELLSSFPFKDVTRIVLPHEGPGGRTRVALGVTVTIGTMDVRVYSVHSETRIPTTQKMDQLRAVLYDLARFPQTKRAIVLGDFNSWELQAIEGARKLFTSAGFTTPFSDDEPTFLRKAVLFDLELKLDWIWLRGLSVQSYGIDRTISVSDHFPLWTVVKLENNSGRFHQWRTLKFPEAPRLLISPCAVTYPSCLRNCQALTETITNAIAARASSCG